MKRSLRVPQLVAATAAVAVLLGASASSAGAATHTVHCPSLGTQVGYVNDAGEYAAENEQMTDITATGLTCVEADYAVADGASWVVTRLGGRAPEFGAGTGTLMRFEPTLRVEQTTPNGKTIVWTHWRYDLGPTTQQVYGSSTKVYVGAAGELGAGRSVTWAFASPTFYCISGC
jgi:hypothetical protein